MTTVATRIVILGLSFLYIFTLLLAGCSTLGRANVVINESADAELKTTIKRGLFLTKAHIGDREAGPFLIDTGASDLFFDVELARALKLSFWGEEEHAETKQKIKFGTLASFEVGPMALQNIRVLVMDFSSVTAGFGEKLAGLLGYPFFAKAVIEVDYPKKSISCFDPKHYRLPRGEWQPLTLKSNRPTVTARLEGNVEGLFLLDTGSTYTVRFLPDFVQKHTLLENRDVSKVKELRLSGESEILAGKIAWFELAGHRFEKPTVRFNLPNTPGTKRLEGLAGIIGQGLMREFIVVFNYPESKIALLRK
jgi:Aspartyl protease